MKVWSQFHPFVLLDVLGCPDPVVAHALLHASREFFERTRTWTVWQDTITTSAGTLDYDFELSQNTEIVKVLRATINSIDLAVMSENDLPSSWRTGANRMTGLVTSDRRTFSVVPARAAGMTIQTFCALKPGNNALGIEDVLFAQFAEEISTGAKARLLSTPKRDYSDIGAAMLYRDQFDQSCNSIARKMEKSFSRTPRRVIPNYF